MSSARILIVEDEQIVAEDLRVCVESLGHAVCGVAASGPAAIEKASEHHPDLVLMDIVLQGDMDGVEAARIIRNKFGSGIIYLTAYQYQSILERAKLTEPHAYLIKPFEERELQPAIEMALHKVKMEATLKESEARLTATLGSIADGVLAVNAEGKIEFMNPVAEALTGWSASEGKGRPLAEVADVIDEFSRNPVALTTDKQERDDMPEKSHLLLVARSGEEVPIETAVTPMDAAGDIGAGAVVVLRDIAERRRAEESLIHAERMAAVGTLAGGVAHEFNNIHAGILGYLELVLAKYELPPAARQKLEVVRNATLRASDVTKNLLAFCHREAASREAMSLSSVVEETLKIVADEFKSEGIEVNLHSSGLVRVSVDKHQMSQVLMNLLINAKHATIGCKERRIDIDLGTEEGRAYMRVRDTGAGIEHDALAKVFTPFYTTKGEHATPGNPQANAKGVGLGLSICATIVENHHGEIRVASQPGNGAAFTVWLPLASSDMSQTQTLSRPHGKESTARILVIDDDAITREFLTDLLELEGHDVSAFDDGADALDLLRNGSVDLVMVDLQMPKMSGVEFLRRLNDLPLGQRPVCLVLTGKFTDPHAEGYADLGVFDTLQKPCRAGVLEERVSAALRSRR